MIKKSAVVAATIAALLLPAAGPAVAKGPTPGAAAAVTGLSCGTGYQCDNTDPNRFSFDKKDTDDVAHDPGCASVELRSGKSGGYWYAWAALNVNTLCGRYQGWIDRSYDGGKTWTLLGFFETSDIEGRGWGTMFFWPDSAKVRAGFKRPNEPWNKSGLTKWH
ncbi:hypothetical protein ACFRMQ_09800 [Kitasatospora sp. NPDC056783]|uniref:hypothetical protein n=1 Tax=Kitasatospora sp. NPDC056783 TaxID=3345943 RepID=UPI00368A2388